MDYIINETADNSGTEQGSLYFCTVDNNLMYLNCFQKGEAWGMI